MHTTITYLTDQFKSLSTFVHKPPIFLSKIYPEFHEPLPSVLLELLHSANAADLVFLASSLRGFKGRSELLPILRAMLASEMASDETEDRVLQVFLETGVMTGEFGGAQTYRAKVEFLKPWLDEENPRIAMFATREIASLKNMVASEHRRAQERIAMRKLQYGEPLEGDDGSQLGDDTPGEDPVIES